MGFELKRIALFVTLASTAVNCFDKWSPNDICTKEELAQANTTIDTCEPTDGVENLKDCLSNADCDSLW
jgi:hypothetical protein